MAEQTEPKSSLAEVLRYFNSDEGMPDGLHFVRVPTGEMSSLSAGERMELRSCLDELRAAS